MLGRATADICGRKKLPFAGYSVVKEQTLVSYRLSTSCLQPPDTRQPILRPELSILRFARNGRKLNRRESLKLPPAEPKPARASCGRRLVENTGLEPVTSWLQTRRSPS